MFCLLHQLLIVFRGTQTTKEWQENATGVMSQLEGEPEVSGLGLLFNREVRKAQCRSLQPNAFCDWFVLTRRVDYVAL